jgi:hypothetical protein
MAKKISFLKSRKTVHSLKSAVWSGFQFGAPGLKIGFPGLNFGLTDEQFRLPSGVFKFPDIILKPTS